MKELLRALRPVKNRIRLGRLLRGAAAGFAFGAAAALVLLVVTLFVPLADRWAAAALVPAGCVLLTAAGNALRPVKDADAARAADGCGLRERTVTALEFAGREADGRAAVLLDAQRKDACEHLHGLDPRKIPLHVPRRILLAGTALVLLCAATALIRGDGDRIAAVRRELAEKIAPMAEKIEKAEAEEEAGRSKKEKAELRKLAEDLKRELEESRDAVDALVALDKAESRLEEMRQKTAGEAMQEIAEGMRSAGMDTAADALENGDAQSLADAFAEMNAGELQQALEGLGEEAKELAELLEQTAMQGELSDAQLQAMYAAQGNPGQGSPLQQALSGMKASLGGNTQQLSGNSSQGTGNNQGQNGGGAGSGTTNEEEKGGGNRQQNAAGKGSRPPEYKEGAYETIYDPEKAETMSRNVSTEQNRVGDDSVQIETGPGKGTLEGNVPFREVVGEYAQTEAQAAESAHLTREQKQWVDDYFRRLTDE